MRALLLSALPGTQAICAGFLLTVQLLLLCLSLCPSAQLRKLNQVVLPVSYSERFYTNIQKPEVTDITKLGQRVLSLRILH